MNNLKIAEDTLLVKNNLSLDSISNVLDIFSQKHIDYADLYAQSFHSESLVLEDGIIKSGSSNIDAGVGLRAISGEKSSLAYTETFNLESLQQAAIAASMISKEKGSDKKKISLSPNKTRELYKAKSPISCMSIDEKIAILRNCERVIKLQSKVVQYSICLSSNYSTVLVAGTDGSLAGDLRPLVRLDVSVVLQNNNRIEKGYAGGGARDTYKYFSDEFCRKLSQQAIDKALLNLDAIEAPAGTQSVVLANGWAGIILHEAIGHGLEADSNRKQASVFHDKMNKQIATEHCTIVDDGTIEGRRGSLNIDDEGVKTQRNVLIENGILKSYMYDKLNASLMGVKSSGNGRRESYKHLPIPRMTNTYMLGGSHSPQEIISTVKNGIYAASFAGGQVDTTSGSFVFSASEAFLIEDGKITKPIKGATLIGAGAEVLKQVSMVGNDMQLDEGVGTCGKDGQWVPVGVGQPTIKIDNITVGGTS